LGSWQHSSIPDLLLYYEVEDHKAEEEEDAEKERVMKTKSMFGA